ncbi:hypothetical protein [Candidatus Lokiarchaeum ossiferum]|uniref:hypothetical protein n=1 Tax=Candidatus Lokiarchaeum ossiferum TaxID=2951803 RepID=UPI00352E0712
MMENGRVKNDSAEIVKIIEQLKEEIIRELPKQKAYLKTQEKFNDELDDLNLAHKENKLVLENVKLEISKFSKGVENANKNQTEVLGDLIKTVGEGFDDFQNHLQKFASNVSHLNSSEIEQSSKKILTTLENDTKTILNSLAPLQSLLGKEQFAKFIAEFNKMLLDISDKLHNKMELSTTEILAGQKILASADLVKNLQNNLYESLVKKLESIYQKIESSPLPTMLESLQKQIGTDITQKVGQIEQKINESPVPNMVRELQIEFGKELNKNTALLSNKIENSPIPQMIQNVDQRLVSLEKNTLLKSNQRMEDHIRKVESPAFFTPLVSQVTKSLSESNARLGKYVDTSILKTTATLGKEKSINSIREGLGVLQSEISKTSKAVDLEKLRKGLDLINALPEINKLQKNLAKYIETAPKDAQVVNIQKTLAQLSSQVAQLSLESSLKQLEKTIQKQDPTPIVKTLIPEVQKLISPLATQKEVKDLSEKTLKMSQDVAKLPNQGIIEKIRQNTDTVIPNRLEQDTKQVLSASKENFTVSSANKELLIKQSEKLNQVNTQLNTVAKNQDLNEFRLLYEKSFPTIKTEIMGEIGKLEKEHLQHFQLLSKTQEELGNLNKSTQKVPELVQFVTKDLYAQVNQGKQDLSQFSSRSLENTTNIEKTLNNLNGKVALESTMVEIKKNTSPEWYKEFLGEIKNAILPVVRSCTEPLAQKQILDSISHDFAISINQILANIGKTHENHTTLMSVAQDTRKVVSNLPNHEEFSSFQRSIDLLVKERLPEIIEEALLLTAKEDSLDKMKAEVRADLKELFAIQTLVQDTTKANREDFEQYSKVFDKFSEFTTTSLNSIYENVSEGAWDRYLDQIKMPLNRLAKEESLNSFKHYFERQHNDLLGLSEDMKQKILVNQTKLGTVQDLIGNTATQENLINLAEIMVSQIKNPLEESLKPSINASAKQDTLISNHEAVMEVLNNFAKRDEILKIQTDQDTMNKFLFKLLKITENNEEHFNYLGEQLVSLSEKLTLLFEFLKRVSGV